MGKKEDHSIVTEVLNKKDMNKKKSDQERMNNKNAVKSEKVRFKYADEIYD